MAFTRMTSVFADHGSCSLWEVILATSPGASPIQSSRTLTLLLASCVAGRCPRLIEPVLFTAEVWTWRGLVTYYTVFVIDLASRRVHILGSTPYPDQRFMAQIGRTLTAADDGVLCEHGVLICDRDRKWSASVCERLGEVGVRVVRTPYRAPNAYAYAERFVRSIKEECLDRLIPLGERHFRQALVEFVAHYHRERNHQGLANRLIEGVPTSRRRGRICCRTRL